MVFVRFFAGLTTGIILPMVVHENVHYCLASCFLEPHLKYQYVKEKRGPHLAIPVHELDTYFKSIITNFGLFFVIIGPTLYQTYVKKQNILTENHESELADQLSEDMTKESDSYVEILKNLKRTQYKASTLANKVKEGDLFTKKEQKVNEQATEQVAELEEDVTITFDDYEKLMERLESESNFKEIQKLNPKYQREQTRNFLEQIEEEMNKNQAQVKFQKKSTGAPVRQI